MAMKIVVVLALTQLIDIEASAIQPTKLDPKAFANLAVDFHHSKSLDAFTVRAVSCRKLGFNYFIIKNERAKFYRGLEQVAQIDSIHKEGHISVYDIKFKDPSKKGGRTSSVPLYSDHQYAIGVVIRADDEALLFVLARPDVAYNKAYVKDLIENHICSNPEAKRLVEPLIHKLHCVSPDGVIGGLLFPDKNAQVPAEIKKLEKFAKSIKASLETALTVWTVRASSRQPPCNDIAVHSHSGLKLYDGWRLNAIVDFTQGDGNLIQYKVIYTKPSGHEYGQGWAVNLYNDQCYAVFIQCSDKVPEGFIAVIAKIGVKYDEQEVNHILNNKLHPDLKALIQPWVSKIKHIPEPPVKPNASPAGAGPIEDEWTDAGVDLGA